MYKWIQYRVLYRRYCSGNWKCDCSPFLLKYYIHIKWRVFFVFLVSSFLCLGWSQGYKNILSPWTRVNVNTYHPPSQRKSLPERTQESRVTHGCHEEVGERVSSSEVLCVGLDACPVHRSVKEVISLKINTSIKKDKENNYFVLWCVKESMSCGVYSHVVSLFPLKSFSLPHT